MGDQDIRAALDRHWAASEAGDDDAEDEIYHDDAVLEYPQSRERILGRLAIRTTRGLLPNKHFTIRRVIGRGDLWVTEYVISYDGKPSHTVVSWSSGMERSIARRSTSVIPSSLGLGAPSGLNRSISRQAENFCRRRRGHAVISLLS